MEKVETQRKEDDVEQLATPMIIVIERSTGGRKYYASYAPNRLGRYWVDGKFYTDVGFDRKYEILMHAYDTPLSYL